MYCNKNELVLLWLLWKMMFMAVDSDVTATVCSPVCEFLCQHPLVIDLLQSNLTGRNSLKDNHIPQIVMKCTTQAEGRDPIRGQNKRQEKPAVSQGHCSQPGGWDHTVARPSINSGINSTHVKIRCLLPGSIQTREGLQYRREHGEVVGK